MVDFHFLFYGEECIGSYALRSREACVRELPKGGLRGVVVLNVAQRLVTEAILALRNDSTRAIGCVDDELHGLARGFHSGFSGMMRGNMLKS